MADEIVQPHIASLDYEGRRFNDTDIYKIVAEKGLTGVCLSGGGIRSATFNLGVLQGMAQLGLLPQIDYLSTGSIIHLAFT